MYRQVIDALYSCVSSCIDMLKSSAIANYFFGGVTLWSVLLAFFVGGLLIRFFLNSFKNSGSVFDMVRNQKISDRSNKGD